MYAAAVLTASGSHFLYGLLVRLVSPRGSWRGTSRRPGGRAGGNYAGSWSWDPGGAGSSWAAATASAIASSVGCISPSSNATRSGLRPTRQLQDPRPGHPGHPGMARQPGHDVDQARLRATAPTGPAWRRLGLRPPRPVRRPGAVDPVACASRTPTPAASAACSPRPPTSRATRPTTPTATLGAKLLSVLLFAAAAPWPMSPVGGRQDVDDVATALMEIGNRSPWMPGRPAPAAPTTPWAGLRHRRDPPGRTATQSSRPRPRAATWT